MAARIRKIRHDDETRLKIQVSQLINRLQDHVLGQVDLTPSQIQAAQILLKKALPDLQAMELQGASEDGSIPVTLVTGVRRPTD
jgi:hypothetical protein